MVDSDLCGTAVPAEVAPALADVCGTYSRYVNRRCRGEACVAANRAYHRLYAAKGTGITNTGANVSAPATCEVPGHVAEQPKEPDA